MPTYRTARSRSSRSRSKGDIGAVAVEFALIVPVLVMILIGTVTTGISFSRALSVTNAVREGARYGATANAASGTWVGDTISRVRSTQFDPAGGQTAICVALYKQGATPSTVLSGCDPSPGPLTAPTTLAANPAVPTGLATGQCVVRVIAARDFSINLVLFGTINRTMSRYAVARYEGTAGC